MIEMVLDFAQLVLDLRGQLRHAARAGVVLVIDDEAGPFADVFHNGDDGLLVWIHGGLLSPLYMTADGRST